MSANESFQDAEADLAALTGMSIGHSTHQRLVGRQSFEFTEAKQGVSEISIDGGKVRLRDLEGVVMRFEPRGIYTEFEQRTEKSSSS